MAASEELASYRKEAKDLEKNIEKLRKERSSLKRGSAAYDDVDTRLARANSRLRNVKAMIARTSKSAETIANLAKKSAVEDIASRTAAAKMGEGATNEQFASEYKKAKSDVRSGRKVGKGKGTTSKARGRGEARMIAEAQQEAETRAKAETKTKAGLDRPGARGEESIRLEDRFANRAAFNKHIRDLAAEVESGARRISSLGPEAKKLVEDYLKAEKPAPEKKTAARKPKAEKPLAGVQSPEQIRQEVAKGEKAKMAAPQPKPEPKAKPAPKAKVEKPAAPAEKPAKKDTVKKAATEKAKKAAKETVAKKAAAPAAEKPKRTAKPKDTTAKAKAAAKEVVAKKLSPAALRDQLSGSRSQVRGGTPRVQAAQAQLSAQEVSKVVKRLRNSVTSAAQIEKIISSPAVRNSLGAAGKLATKANIAVMLYDVIKDPSLGADEMRAWAKKNPNATVKEVFEAATRQTFGMDKKPSAARLAKESAKRAGRMIPADRGRDKGARPYTEGRRADQGGRKAPVVGSPRTGAKTSQNRSVGRLGATGGTHTVKRGDTLWDIAQTNKTTVSALLKANPVIAERRKAGKTSIYSGSKVRIPGKK